MIAERLATDLAALAADPGAWVSLIVVCGAAVVTWLVGHVVTQRTGILGSRPDGWESAAFGLGTGIVLIGSSYALLRASGMTLFAPAAILLLAALVFGRGHVSLPRLGRPQLVGMSAAALCLVLTATIYGITVAPSQRDGAQPVEFMDEAYYAVLGSQLSSTGIESVVSPAAVGDLPGSPARAWYHWGEGWLAALVGSTTGLGPMQARHLVVLPLLLLATAIAAGCFAGRFLPMRYRTEGSLLAAFGMLTIAPIPLVLEDHFDAWARPIGFTMTLYGLTFVVVLLLLCVAAQRRSSWSWNQALVVGALGSALLASHVLVAATAFVGASATATVLWLTHRDVDVRSAVTAVKKPLVALILAGGITVAWAAVGGYGFGERAVVADVQPFDVTWWRGVGLVLAGGGILIVGTVVAIAIRREQPFLFALSVGALAAVAAGAIVWGIRLADFNAFHIFYGTLAVVLTPVSVATLVVGALSQRGTSRRGLATVGILLIAAQGAIGIGTTVSRLYEFGPGHYEPVPVAALEAIRALPPTAKLAYACKEVEEVAIWDARLISLYAHTDRPVVPMCFQVDVFGVQLRQPPTLDRMNPFFAIAPQRGIYPTPDAVPTTDQVRAFLRGHGIDYLWADPDHPNTLVPDATEVFRSGNFAVLRVN